MTVVLLDPLRPDMIPVGAAQYFAGSVVVTEDVHPSLLWQLQSYTLADAYLDADPTATILTSDPAHPLVRQRISRGDTVVRGDRVAGEGLLAAVDLMDRLRRTGPWERQQTHDSLRRYLLEEAYELLDAIDHGTQEDLLSELGDLLLQVLFHARIAEDAAVAPFGIDEVAASFVEKVTHRTPGVLSGEHQNLERQIEEWEAAKASERLQGSVLDGVVTSQPALSLTQKLFERLAGADFPVEAVSPGLYQVKVPFRKHARDSVEDDHRRRALALMEQVRAAEAAAYADGVVLREEQLWRKYLGMSHDLPADGSHLSPVEPVSPVEGEPTSLVEPVETTIPAPAPASSLTGDPAEITSPIPAVGRHSASASPAEPVEASGEDTLVDVVETTFVDVADTDEGPAVELTEITDTLTAEVVDDDAPSPLTDQADSAPLTEQADDLPLVERTSPSSAPAQRVETSGPAEPRDSSMTVKHAETPVQSDFPDVEDFPGPPPAKIHVNDDPILAEERAITVNYSSDVPGMVITESWSAKDDDE